MMQTTEKPTCSHCGGEVTTKGRKPKSGKRYCSLPGCRQARDRERARRYNSPADRQAPTECTHCRAVLPPRRWRSWDVLGRFCTRAACKRAKTELREAVVGGVDLAARLEKLQTALAFAEDCVRCDSEDFLGMNRLVCHECGLTSAVPQWVHPDEDGGACEGTLDGLEIRAYGRSGLYVGWPFARRYLTAAELAEAYPE